MRLGDRANKVAPADAAARARVSWLRQVGADAPSASAVGQAINGGVRRIVRVRM